MIIDRGRNYGILPQMAKKITKQSVIRLVKKQLDAVGHEIEFELVFEGT